MKADTEAVLQTKVGRLSLAGYLSFRLDCHTSKHGVVCFLLDKKLRPLFARGVIALMLGGTVSTSAPQAEGKNEALRKTAGLQSHRQAAEPVDPADSGTLRAKV